MGYDCTNHILLVSYCTLSISYFFYQVSFDSTSITLTDRSTFPNVFRTVPSDESLPPALATLMNYYGWRQLTIITEREPQFIKLLPLFNDDLSRSGITAISLAANDLTSTAGVIKETNSRILYLNLSPRLALFYLCKVSDNMYN